MLCCAAQVFSALDRAQRRMGFHHADLGLRNVMEHYPMYVSSIAVSPPDMVAVCSLYGPGIGPISLQVSLSFLQYCDMVARPVPAIFYRTCCAELFCDEIC